MNGFAGLLEIKSRWLKKILNEPVEEHWNTMALTATLIRYGYNRRAVQN